MTMFVEEERRERERQNDSEGVNQRCSEKIQYYIIYYETLNANGFLFFFFNEMNLKCEIAIRVLSLLVS